MLSARARKGDLLGTGHESDFALEVGNLGNRELYNQR